MKKNTLILADELRILQWCEPPRSTAHRSSEWDAIALECMTRPGEFAYIGGYAKSIPMAAQTRGLEVVTRPRKDGYRDIYVRWPAEGPTWWAHRATSEAEAAA